MYPTSHSAHPYHAPDLGSSGPYGVIHERECVLDTAHGPPASRASPVTVTVIDVMFSAGHTASEYSIVNVS